MLLSEFGEAYDRTLLSVDMANLCQRLLLYIYCLTIQSSGGLSNSQSAHDVSACDDDDGYGEIGVYARHTGTVYGVGEIWIRKSFSCMWFAGIAYDCCRYICE